MRVEVIPCLNDNLCYLVYDEHSNVTLLIDASEAEPIQRVLKKLNRKISAVLLTHHHHDHVGALGQLDSVPLYCSEYDQNRVGFAGPRQDSELKVGLKDDQVLSFESLQVKVHRLRGHTAGQIGFEVQSTKKTTANQSDASHFFSGDTLFSFGCGRCLEGTPNELFESMKVILSLPPETRLHFGHEYSERNLKFWMHHAQLDKTDGHWLKLWLKHVESFRCPQVGEIRSAPTLRDELSLNPFLILARSDSRAEFVEWRKKRDGF